MRARIYTNIINAILISFVLIFLASGVKDFNTANKAAGRDIPITISEPKIVYIAPSTTRKAGDKIVVENGYESIIYIVKG